MRIKTIYTDTANNLKDFALAKGWKETVLQNVDGEEVQVPNPVTFEMFLQSFTKQRLIEIIEEPKVMGIQLAMREQAQQAIMASRMETVKKVEIIVE
jgi:hypothetical protein